MAPGSGGGRRVFGQSMGNNNKKSSSSSRYQRQFGNNNRTVYRSADTTSSTSSTQQDLAVLAAQRRRRQQAAGQAVDEAFGVETFSIANVASTRAAAAAGGSSVQQQRRGWLYNVLPTTATVSNDTSTAASSSGGERAGLDLYFCTDSGKTFKSTILYRPYFYVLPDLSRLHNSNNIDIILEMLTSHLTRWLGGDTLVHQVQVVSKMDLDMPNHLSPHHRNGRPILKLIFDTTSQLTAARDLLQQRVANQQRQRQGSSSNYQHDSSFLLAATADAAQPEDPLDLIQDIREYDVPYVVRVCTDLDIRAGTWYTVELDNEDDGSAAGGGGVRLTNPDRESKANPCFLAFDIECTKAPLKFPRADVDEIFMISYMVSTPSGAGQGYLIVSRSVVSQDVSDFEYTPKPNYPGPFHIFNEPNEKALLERFFSEYRRLAPQIVVTYNGDFFDWPFVDARAQVYGMDLFQHTGISRQMNDEYRGRSCVHLDAFHWVQRDSYLPQGAQGLKAVTKYKLGYDPVEVDPEDMVRFAQERPVHMATYSVSDAVATYYLHQNYVHLFIFSLCTIIPMGPEDVLTKGSGTLCESLLMAQACNKSIVCPNKQVDPLASFHKGHLLESETYIGGKVECLETGVYRSDLEYEFDLKPEAFQELIDHIDRDLTFAIEVEGGLKKEDIVNYDEIRGKIVGQLGDLRDRPKRTEKPYVYHLDVGAMYPNIILTNRLQPSAIVDDATCAACDYNQAKNKCKRAMNWIWRGDYNPASKTDYERTQNQLSREVIRDGLLFDQLPEKEQATLVASRLKTYAKKAYSKTKITEEETREDTVCMRANDFYVDTVRQFRDRRYDFKRLNKQWKKSLSNAKDAATKKACEDKVLVYDSLQIAHKCILNSFYGYVMRKGARWRSMEMAGIVTKTGSDIITQARKLVERIGRPLELDTDGIWCILPVSFPDVYNFVSSDGSKIKLEYPCVMLNADVQDKFSNDQYQTLVDPERGTFSTHSECSIFFEVDGPYRCMFLPASTEEGKLLKKRYAVYNHDKSLAELKGFELKRRGELELVKAFQGEVFQRFLEGSTLEECYASAAEIANHWIDVIDTRGESLDEEELFDLISENRSMSKQLEEYGEQKGTSQTTARRLGEFLGLEIIKDKGLNCKFIIAEQPYGAPVTERAIPTAIWKAESAVMKHFLRKWLKAPGLDGDALDIRNVLDWDYYLDRLGKTIQKIITIPAALQKIPNPVPRVPHPPWLESKVKQLNDRFQQRTILSMFGRKPVALPPTEGMPVRGIEDIGENEAPTGDIEEIGRSGAAVCKRPVVHSRRRPLKHLNDSGTENDTNSTREDRVILSKDNEGFSTWLQQKKAKWRKSRRERPRRNTEGTVVEKKARKAFTMEGFVRDAAMTLSQKEWHIVEVRGSSIVDFHESGASTSLSGEFIVYLMIGETQLQKIRVSVPRVVYISTRKEIECSAVGITGFRKVDKHLPHGKNASFVYEVEMPEYVFRKQEWIKGLKSLDGESSDDVLEALYESGTPLLTRILSEIGSVSRLRQSASNDKFKKSYDLCDLSLAERPSDGEYLNKGISYKRMFLYIRLHPKTRIGIVALFTMAGGSGSFAKKTSDDDMGDNDTEADITRPSSSQEGSFDASASCNIWIVKPGSKKAQKNVSRKQCDALFLQLLDTIQESGSLDSEYSRVSPSSDLRVSHLNFVDTEELAFAGANEAVSSALKSHQGATFLLLSSNRQTGQVRRFFSSFSSVPVVPMPCPPGPAHSPTMATLPAISWEQPAVQLCLEAYLFTVIIAYPKRVSYARYGHVPLGNLGDDENLILYEVGLSRIIKKNRTLSWASPVAGSPDIGVNFLPSSDGDMLPSLDANGVIYNEDEIWGEDDELVSPVIRRPGCYRSVCVDIDIQDLAIAALTDYAATSLHGNMTALGHDPSSPQSVLLGDGTFDSTKLVGPLGDEMATSVSLHLVRSLVSGWLRDAFVSNSLVADELLHHIYRLVSDQMGIFNDPSLHRIVHALMKTTFVRLLGELQRLGCSIVFATFHRVIVATGKVGLADAEEYVNFVISTVRQRASSDSGDSDALAKVALRPRLFHTQFVFRDEFNFGTMQLDRIDANEMDEETGDLVIPDDGNEQAVIVPSVVTAWSVMNYLGSETAQEYFRIVIGRFSKDVLKKQMALHGDDGDGAVLAGVNEKTEKLLSYKKKMISTYFASYLTRAVDEISKDGLDDQAIPPLMAKRVAARLNPALEFVKNVVAVLELDSEVEEEVHALKRSLLAQLGIAEYAEAAQWVNPCPSFVLPDVFCSECYESRDVNLCYVPPRDPEDPSDTIVWACQDCGTPYDSEAIESRLIGLVHRKVTRYQLQDVRCSKTNRVTKSALSPASEVCGSLKLDISSQQAQEELQLIQNLAIYHDLELLTTTTEGLLSNYDKH